MGLSGRKIKQRIGADPRNLSWADDASKFGSAYLAKFGWDSSKGLGASGDGRTSHVKVQQKLDMLGIGAAHMHDPNGIAWKQNRDFENLLKRLNEQGNGEEGERLKVEGFINEGEVENTAEEVQEGSEKKRKKDKERKKKKDKRDREDGSEDGKKRKREDKEDKGRRTKKRKSEDESSAESVEKQNERSQKPSETPAPVAPPVIPRHRAHRARAIAAKKMLSSSATAISEILGIAPTPSSSIPSGSSTPQGKLTTLDNDVMGEQITTSTKSVADYFKEKLLSKSAGQSRSSTPWTTSNDDVDAYDTPRGGLGSSCFRMDNEGTGMNQFSSLMSSKLLAAASAAPSPEDTPEELKEKSTSQGQKTDKKEKKKKKHKEADASEQPKARKSSKEKKRRKEEE